MQMIKMHICFLRETILTHRQAALLHTLFYYKPAVIRQTEQYWLQLFTQHYQVINPTSSAARRVVTDT